MEWKNLCLDWKNYQKFLGRQNTPSRSCNTVHNIAVWLVYYQLNCYDNIVFNFYSFFLTACDSGCKLPFFSLALLKIVASIPKTNVAQHRLNEDKLLHLNSK